jgi:hypothetical protein
MRRINSTHFAPAVPGPGPHGFDHFGAPPPELRGRPASPVHEDPDGEDCRDVWGIWIDLGGEG